MHFESAVGKDEKLESSLKLEIFAIIRKFLLKPIVQELKCILKLFTEVGKFKIKCIFYVLIIV